MQRPLVLSVLFLTGCLGQRPCEWDGQTLAHGASVPQGCNTCTCDDGVVYCTQMGCADSG